MRGLSGDLFGSRVSARQEREGHRGSSVSASARDKQHTRPSLRPSHPSPCCHTNVCMPSPPAAPAGRTACQAQSHKRCDPGRRAQGRAGPGVGDPGTQTHHPSEYGALPLVLPCGLVPVLLRLKLRVCSHNRCLCSQEQQPVCCCSDGLVLLLQYGCCCLELHAPQCVPPRTRTCMCEAVLPIRTAIDLPAVSGRNAHIQLQIARPRANGAEQHTPDTHLCSHAHMHGYGAHTELGWVVRPCMHGNAPMVPPSPSPRHLTQCATGACHFSLPDAVQPRYTHVAFQMPYTRSSFWCSLRLHSCMLGGCSRRRACAAKCKLLCVSVWRGMYPPTDHQPASYLPWCMQEPGADTHTATGITTLHAPGGSAQVL